MSEEGQVKTDELDAQAEARRRLALAQIRQYPDPVLRLEAQEVEDFDDDLAQLVERMTRLMQDARGVGLAANQVGVLRRVFVIQADDEHGAARARQPVDRRALRRERRGRRGLPLDAGRRRLGRAPGARSGSRRSDEEGKPVTLELEGLPARVAQHELDHLDGVLILDRTTPEDRREAMAVLRQAVRAVKLAVAATAPLGADVLERLADKHDDRVPAHAAGPAAWPRPESRRAAGQGGRRAAGHPGPAAREAGRVVRRSRSTRSSSSAYGALIPASLLDRALWLNVHPSLLPRWRGAAPIERAIMAGDDESARLGDQARRGARRRPDRRAAQRSRSAGDTTAGDVYAETARLAPELIDEALADDSFAPQVGEPTYAEKIGPADRELDWSRPPKELHDRIRALTPHIGARGELHGRNLTVWRSRLDGDELHLLEVQPDGGTRMPYGAWLRGLRSRP